MQHRDASVENSTRNHEQAAVSARIKMAKAKAMHFNGQPHNIVNHEWCDPTRDNRSQADHLRDMPRAPTSSVTYDILSHKSIKAHAKAGLVDDEPTPRRPLQKRDERFGDGPLPESHNMRPFDVVNNRFRKDHEGKTKTELDKLQDETEVRYWQTHNYDPVVGKYYDKNKEAEYRKQRGALERVQGASQALRQPPSMQYAEGAAYNIMTHSVKDVDKAKRVEDMNERSVNNKSGSKIQERIRHRAEAKVDLAAKQMLNRFSATCDLRDREDGRKHGFNLLTNESYSGMNARPLAPSRLSTGPNVWAKLHGEVEYSVDRGSIKPRAPRDVSGGGGGGGGGGGAATAAPAAVPSRGTARQNTGRLSTGRSNTGRTTGRASARGGGGSMTAGPAAQMLRSESTTPAVPNLRLAPGGMVDGTVSQVPR